MKLGPIQKAWLKNLRAHPERQMEEQLGERTNDGGYKVCCLGEALLTLYREYDSIDIESESEFLDHVFQGDGVLYDHGAMEALENSYDELGLRDSEGVFDNIRLGDAISLAEANDLGYTWLQIADFIEENPETVFSRSV